MGFHICTQTMSLFAMSSSSYLYAHRQPLMSTKKCGAILSFTFVMAIEPTSFVYVVLADRQGHHSQLMGTIESVLVIHLYLFYHMFL